MQFCYAIKDWDKHFENSESRKIKSLTWLPVKNKHDGKGYRRVCQHSKSTQVFCAWNLIIQVASKMPVRGLLRDDDGPLTASDLSSKTGYPEHIFEEAFKVLTETKIGWLIKVQTPNGREIIPSSPETSGNIGIEQKGTEGNRREGHGREGKDKNISLLSKLSVGMLGGVAQHILANADSWTYDNCKVQVADFTPGGLKTVLLPFLERVTVGQAQMAWKAATAVAHAAAVDGSAKNPPAYCLEIFKRKLAEAVTINGQGVQA